MRRLVSAIVILIVCAVAVAWLVARLTGAGGPSGAAQLSSTTSSSSGIVRAASADGGEPRSTRNANYVIAVDLDPETHTLKGTEHLEWRNITRSATAELQFHLYYNAWKNTRSTFFREASVAWDKLDAARESGFGWIDVTAVRQVGTVGGNLDLTSRKRFVSPDDGNQDDQTVMSVALPRPIEPGETADLEIEWTARIPRTVARTGFVGNYYFIAQWFPKIGVLEDNGWNCHQFHAATEFFADYGVYDVSMTVPRGWVVGATGRERERRDRPDGKTTHRYYEEDVHDFAWTTSPNYIERHARFEKAGLPPVDMRLLLQPEHLSQAARHFKATEAALGNYGSWFGPYPYGHITIVDPAWQSGAGGMEYPTLFTAGTAWLAPEGTMMPEHVTVHECGHQFWYAIVGNNEFEDAWLDEGLNTYSTARVTERAYPHANHVSEWFFGDFVPYVFPDFPIRRVDEDGLAGYRQQARADIPSKPSWRYWPGGGGALSYNKTALWLHTLERQLGWPVFRKCLATYFDRWKFRHPKPLDFFAVVNEVSGRDLTWFFDQVYDSSRVFDYGVDRLETGRPVDTGFFDRKGRAQFVRERTGAKYHTTVVVRRYQDGVFPVDLLVTFADGAKVREKWDGRDQWKAFTFDRGAPAVAAEVDPDRVLVLDVNETNNSRSVKPESSTAANALVAKWLVWMQDLLLTYAYFV